MTTAKTQWAALDVLPGSGSDPAAFGGSLGADELLEAYRHGLFPLPADDETGAAINRALYEPEVEAGRISLLPGDGDPYRLAWFLPDQQWVIPVESVRLNRSTRQVLRNRYASWHTTVNQAFAEVVEACRHGRHPQWITEELVVALRALHESGWAHSVEVWDGEHLVGGVFGIAFGSVFSADSMFHAVSPASKVAMAELADRLAPTSVRVVNVQVASAHARELGAQELPLAEYARLLGGGENPVRLSTDRRPAHRLAAPKAGHPTLPNPRT